MKLPEGIKIYGYTSFRGVCPSETLEIVTFFNSVRKEYPSSYGLLAYHPRNESKRTHYQAMRDKSEGMVTGTSDIIIVGSPSFVCEVKRRDHTKSTITQEQITYLLAAQEMGAFSCIALGCDAAEQAFKDWLKLQVKNPYQF